MTFRTGLLKRVDRIRRIPQKLDLRQNTIDIVLRKWSSGTVGKGTKSETIERLYVGGNCNIRVRQVTSEDIVASGGLLTAQDIKIGPFTPEFPGGGLPQFVYDPPSQGAEVLFIIKGHGFEDGRQYKRKTDSAVANFTSWLFLSSTGAQI